MGVLISLLTGAAGSFFDDWKARRQNQRDIEKAVADNKIRLAQSLETHNENWEMAALTGGDNLVRRASFLVWSAPMIWAAFDPKGAAAFFKDALAALPDWYVGGYLAISGAVWGLSELKALGIVGGGK